MLGTIREPVEARVEAVAREEVEMVEAEVAVERTGVERRTKQTPPRSRLRILPPEPKRSLDQKEGS